jgi:hypothetical protein
MGNGAGGVDSDSLWVVEEREHSLNKVSGFISREWHSEPLLWTDFDFTLSSRNIERRHLMNHHEVHSGTASSWASCTSVTESNAVLSQQSCITRIAG